MNIKYNSLICSKIKKFNAILQINRINSIFLFFLLEHLIAIILFIDRFIDILVLETDFAFVLLPTTSFLCVPTRCQLYVVLQCTTSHPMQLVQHAILYSLTRSVTTFLSPLLFYFVYVCMPKSHHFIPFDELLCQLTSEFVTLRISSFAKTRDIT